MKQTRWQLEHTHQKHCFLWWPSHLEKTVACEFIDLSLLCASVLSGQPLAKWSRSEEDTVCLPTEGVVGTWLYISVPLYSSWERGNRIIFRKYLEVSRTANLEKGTLRWNLRVWRKINYTGQPSRTLQPAVVGIVFCVLFLVNFDLYANRQKFAAGPRTLISGPYIKLYIHRQRAIKKKEPKMTTFWCQSFM